MLAFSVVRGAPLLRADDIAALNAQEPGDAAGLGWFAPGTLRALGALVDGWSDRGLRERYRASKSEREALLACLGLGLPSDARGLVVLAAQLGRSFSSFPDDYDDAAVWRLAKAAGVLPSPRAFLGESANPPPRLGQMTPMAAVRRWCGAFWYGGQARSLRVFGPIPEPQRIPLPAVTVQSLQRAVDERVLRVAVVAWRQHARSELTLDRRARRGTFAVTGLTRAAAPGRLSKVAELLAQHRVHLAVLPEIMLDATELGAFSAALATQRRRYPALTVAGRAHERAGANDRFINTAVVLDAGGRVLFSHEKLEPYTDEQFGPEDIVPRESESYLFADSPVGRLVVNVCRDIRSDVPMLLNRVLGASLLAVPAYSPRLDFVCEEARLLGARQQAIVIAANPLVADLRHVGHVYAPVRGQQNSEIMLLSKDVEIPEGMDAFVQVLEIREREGRNAELTPVHAEAV